MNFAAKFSRFLSRYVTPSDAASVEHERLTRLRAEAAARQARIDARKAAQTAKARESDRDYGTALKALQAATLVQLRLEGGR